MQSTQQHITLDHIFRHEYGKIISILVHKFGPHNIEKIEDVVQDAFVKAMQVWGYKGTPENPTAWLLRVSSNRLIDVFRRDRKMQEHDALFSLIKTASTDQESIQLRHQLQDSQLKMIFACCNPTLSSEYQLILSLKLIGGFSNKEISRALLKKEETVAKSFTRAKKQFQERIKTIDVPIEMGLKSRIHLVLKVIYLLFTEGYTASTGEEIIKRDFCYEAIRLALLMTENESTNVSEVHGLIALMCFHTARFDARVDQNGDLIDLEHQNRSQYNQQLIRSGMHHFQVAKNKRAQNPLYFLQAAVSYYYCEANSFQEIDWESILQIYNTQLKYSYSPIIRLNRIIPLYKIEGAKAGLQALEELYLDTDLENNALYYSIKAQLLQEVSRKEEAKDAYAIAIQLTKNEVQKKHLVKKRDQIA